MRTKIEIERRIAKLQKLKKKNPDHSLLYSIEQTSLEEISWVLYETKEPQQ
ncbi:MAG: hypothetical protein JRM77_06935 [Nitrososphaerota archaeon]|nr:hypothetical protein [Nitrososphaerota archaeon]